MLALFFRVSFVGSSVQITKPALDVAFLDSSCNIEKQHQYGLTAVDLARTLNADCFYGRLPG